MWNSLFQAEKKEPIEREKTKDPNKKKGLLLKFPGGERELGEVSFRKWKNRIETYAEKSKE